MRKKRVVWGSLFCLGLSSLLKATDVTLYNDNLGLVREPRVFELKEGVNTVMMDEVAAEMDATSVQLTPVSGGDGFSVLEQNFQYDLINEQKLLEKYVGREIEIERPASGGGRRETLRGTLLSSGGGRVLQSGGKLYVNPEGREILPELPEGFVTKPRLVWKVVSQKSGKQACEVAYMTRGLGWHSDYVVKISPSDDKLDINAWVTLTNRSGVAYREAKLKLVAGDVNRLSDETSPGPLMRTRVKMASADMAPSFQEKSFFEYHLYTLQRPSTLLNNETKQIELTSARNVPVKKLFIYDPTSSLLGDGFFSFREDENYGSFSDEKKVWTLLEFKNSKDNNMGLPLPKGRIRVYKQDTDGALEFVGEDAIDHTPKDERIRIKTGNAFDLVGERTRTAYQTSTNRESILETFSIKVRNHKSAPVTVRVVEHLYRWSNWRITESSQKWNKRDAQTIEFDVNIQANGEGIVTYTVKYSW